MKLDHDDIQGSGGGGGKSGDSGGKEASNTLRSGARARLLELISEGEVESVLPRGGNSIYFDQTPIVNENGSVNFKGIKWESRNGLPDQEHFLGNASAETPFSVETRVRYDVAPIVRTIAEANATSVRVVVRVPTLADGDNDKGNVNPSSVSWAIDVRPNAGAWVEKVRVDLINQKCTSAYEKASRVDLPAGGFPWDIRVRRITPDATSTKIQNETYWSSYTTVVEGKFTYPHCAMVWLDVDASLFSQGSIPARYYHVKGLKIHVPTNYNPITRAYTGIWDGTFKIAWTNNPAWVLYDLLINDRYGLGEFVDPTRVDKWSLYQIAQYCDTLVPNGYGTTEPRYTFNAQLNSRDEAFKVLQQVTTAFRGMAYWSLGQVFASADQPSDPVKLVTPANVIDGHFNYMGTALKTRHSVAIVTWNDPQDFYRPAKEVVINEEQLRLYGWRETSVQAIGCTSRGLAHRYGKWVLDTEQNATETVEYVASWDHTDIRPGDIIAIADPRKAQVRTGGRLTNGTALSVIQGPAAPGEPILDNFGAAITDHNGQIITATEETTGGLIQGATSALSTTVIYLDQPFVPAPGITYTLMVEMPEGGIEQRVISAFSNGNKTVTLATPLSVAPQAGAVWIITGSDVAPRQYRVLSIGESEAHLFKITALFHDPSKFARVEEDLQLDPIAYTRPKTTIMPPSNLVGGESLYFLNGLQASRVTLSWTPSDDFMARGYVVTAESPSGFLRFPEVMVPSFQIDNAELGTWIFYVSSISKDGRTSPPVEVTVVAAGWGGVAAPEVVNLKVFNRTDTIFPGRDCRIVWDNLFHNSTTPGDIVTASASGITNPFYQSNEIKVFDYDTNALLRTETVGINDYVYTYAKNFADTAGSPKRHLRFEVRVKDVMGRTSAAAGIAPNNPVPAVMTVTALPGLEQIFISFVTPPDIDYRGAKVWMSTVSGFDPLVTAPIYEGPNSALSFPSTPDVPYYIRVAGYDEFGRDGLAISAELSVTSSSVGVDLTPPAIPLSLTLTPSILTLASGEVQSIITADWADSASGNFAYFDVQIQEGAGAWFSEPTTVSTAVWRGLKPAQAYSVRVRAISKSGAASAFLTAVTTTTLAKTTAPGLPTAMAAVASLKSAFLSWVNPADTDLAYIEIWRHTANTFGSATKIGTSMGTAFTVTGLVTGTPYFFWLKSVNTSGIISTNTASFTVTPGQVAEGDIAANAITADKITAGTITGDKLHVTAQLPVGITVGATGTTIGAIESRSTDPAGRINAFTTAIDPGKILISGATTLANWRSGTDLTKIEGGSIAANSVSANKIQVGDRNITVANLEFSFDKTTSTLSWSAGTIGYINDLGTYTTYAITAGSVVWTTGVIYVAWQKDTTALSTSTTPWSPVTYHTLATYQGSNILVANYGRTIIDGDKILTGSIVAAKIAAGTITANELAANSVTAAKIAAGAITADKIGAGTITATGAIYIGGTNFLLSAPNQNLVVSDGTYDRVKIGNIGAGAWGIEVRGPTGALIMSSGVGLSMPITGLTGQFTSANIGTYFAAAAIQDAQIANLSASKITAASLSAISADLGTVTAGVARDAANKFVINFTAGTLSVSE